MQRLLIILALAGGCYWWWSHREQPTPVKAENPRVAVQTTAVNQAAATPARSATAPAPSGSSWPRRQIDRAQAAGNAAKAQHEGL